MSLASPPRKPAQAKVDDAINAMLDRMSGKDVGDSKPFSILDEPATCHEALEALRLEGSRSLQASIDDGADAGPESGEGPLQLTIEAVCDIEPLDERLVKLTISLQRAEPCPEPGGTARE